MKMQNIVVIALLALMQTAIAQNPIDGLTGSFQEQVNTVGQQLQQKTVQHIVGGNLTQEQIIQDLNATTEQLEQKAKEELKKQLDKNAQLPGFEYASALVGMLGTAVILRRRC
jgi:hypothetical protein